VSMPSLAELHLRGIDTTEWDRISKDDRIATGARNDISLERLLMSQGDHRDEVKKREDAQNSILQATKNRLISEAERVMSRNQATPLHIRAQWACENHLEAQQTMDPWTEVPQGLKQPLIRRAAYTPCPPRPARGCHLSRRELQACTALPVEYATSTSCYGRRGLPGRLGAERPPYRYEPELMPSERLYEQQFTRVPYVGAADDAAMGIERLDPWAPNYHGPPAEFSSAPRQELDFKIGKLKASDLEVLRQ